MEEPQRLSEIDPAIGMLLSAGRRERASDESRNRALELVGAGAAASVAIATSKSSYAVVAAKVTCAVLFVVGAVVLAVRVRSSPIVAAPPTHAAVPSVAAPAVEPAPVASAVASTIPSVVASSAPRPMAKKTVAAVESASAAAPAVVDDTAAELATVSAAHAALKAGDAKGALAKIALWQQQFKGVFAEEAEAIRVDALVATGSHEEAAKRAATFVARWPNSPHAARMRAVVTP